MQVDKSNRERLELCSTCKHEAVAQDVWPCSGCWNPMGDMYESKAPTEPIKKRIFIGCKHCNGMGEIEVPNDANETRR